jgi:hypothetical protein
LLAEATIFAAVQFRNPERDLSPVLAALVPTLIIFAGACLALARTRYQWKASILQREIDAKKISLDTEIETIPGSIIRREDLNWSASADVFYFASLFLTFTAGLSLLLLLWCPVIPFCRRVDLAQ